MAETIGKVQEVNGNFQIVDENGNAVQLQEGLEVKIGDQIQGVVEVVNGQIQLVDESGNILELIDGQTLNTLDETTVNANQNTTIELNNGQEVIVNNQNNLLLDQTVTNNAPVDFQDTVIDNDTLDSLENDLVNEENLVVENDNDNNENNEEEQIQSDSSKARELDRNADVANVIADLREPVLNFREEDENIFGDDILFTQATLSISGASIVYEGNETIYTLSLTETASTDMLVTLSYSGVAIDGTDYTSIKEVTIPAGEKETTFIIETIDDYISDNNEPYTIVIIDAVGGGFDNLFIDSQADRVTTTIIDDSKPNTPNDPSDPEEPGTLDSVTVKLVSTDINGNEIAPATIAEGETAYYKAILVDPSGNQIVGASGNVDITFTDDSAKRTGTAANSDLDFAGTNQTVALNTVFSANALDDYVADSGETFNVQITDDTYTNATAYENVIHDTTAVVTTIIDDNDTVYVKLTQDSTVYEGENLTHTVTLVDLNGDPISPASNTSITVNLEYPTSTDETENVDFNPTRTIQVTIGSSGTATISNSAFDDILVEGSESYKLKILSILDNNSTYENILPTNDNVIGIIYDDVEPNPDTSTVKEGSNTITGNILTNDEIGINGKITQFDYTDESGNTQTATLIGGTASVDTIYGNITVNENGSYTFTSDPKEDHSSGDLSDIITYTLSDGTLTETSTLTITVTDDTPTAVVDTKSIIEDEISVSDNVFDSSNNSQDDVIGADTTSTPVTGVKAGSDTSADATSNVASDVIGTYGKVNIAS
ncbi:immunoglobulin-like domain-containing protein, partial [Malaciobacter pacificus]